jgi:hypothetical protein
MLPAGNATARGSSIGSPSRNKLRYLANCFRRCPLPLPFDLSVSSMSKAEKGILKTILEVKKETARHEEQLKTYFRDNIETYRAAGGREQLVRELDIQRHKHADATNRKLADATRKYWKNLKEEQSKKPAKKKVTKKR